MPIGVAGEICIGGVGVATGYLGRPGLTAERFIPDLLSERAGARLYRTGDLGCWGADGKLRHLGRLDHQVKIRGFRIELGEIETLLRGHEAVREAVVVARDAQPGDQRLVAYLVYHDGEDLTPSDVRRYLREQLPDFMIPSIVMAVECLPLTPNGKVDRSAPAGPVPNVAARYCRPQPAGPRRRAGDRGDLAIGSCGGARFGRRQFLRAWWPLVVIAARSPGGRAADGIPHGPADAVLPHLAAGRGIVASAPDHVDRTSISLARSMTPFYFGTQRRRLFGIYEPAVVTGRSKRGGSAVLSMGP